MNNIKSCTRVFADLDQINECKINLDSNQEAFENLSGLLALAGNEVRLKILYLLDKENELCPCDLSDILNMSVPAISQHLRKMKDGSILKTRRYGKTIYYSLEKNQLELLHPLFQHISLKSKELV
jgi:DNA-binding transcriptional ArsR family regulator